MTGSSADIVVKAGLVAVFALIVGFAAASFTLAPSYDRFDFLYEDYRMSTCLEEFGSDTALTTVDLPAASEACYAYLLAQGQLNEFQIRRVNFQTQHVADQMLMWMVIGLTLSGVVLAAVQIVGANRVYIASGGAQGAIESEVSIEAGKVYVKSAATGVVILLISFAFFFVYVAEVYTIKEVVMSDEAQLPPVEAAPEPEVIIVETTPGTGDMVEGGGLGLPPDLVPEVVPDIVPDRGTDP